MVLARSSVGGGSPRPALRGHGVAEQSDPDVEQPVGHGAAALAQALNGLVRLGRPLRIWCAGAGGPGEPLTVLLLAAAAGLDVDVVATDVDGGAIAVMRAGRVPGRLLRLPRAMTAGRLVAEIDGHRPGPVMAARLRVAEGDLRAVPAGGPFDLIVCRDVLHHYRTGAADAMLRGLLLATAADGVVVVTAVDALAAGRPLSGRQDVLLRRGPPAEDSLEAFVDDDDAHPALRLAALTDPDADLSRRAGRLLRLADRGSDLEEARLAAGGIALAEGQLDLARQLLEQPVTVAGEGDASTLLALAALKNGDHHSARALLARAQPTSWLAPYLLGRLLQRLQRPGDANAHFRLALSLLEGGGVAPIGSAFIEGCAPDHAVAACRGALRARSAVWHGP